MLNIYFNDRLHEVQIFSSCPQNNPDNFHVESLFVKNLIIKWMPIYFISRYSKRYKNLSMLLRSIREERIKFVLPAYFSPLKLHLPLYHGFFKSHIKYWWTRTSILEHGGCLIEPLPEDFSTFSCLVSPSPPPVAVEGYRLTRVNTSFQQQFEQWFNNV